MLQPPRSSLHGKAEPLRSNELGKAQPGVRILRACEKRGPGTATEEGSRVIALRHRLGLKRIRAASNSVLARPLWTEKKEQCHASPPTGVAAFGDGRLDEQVPNACPCGYGILRGPRIWKETEEELQCADSSWGLSMHSGRRYEIDA